MDLQNDPSLPPGLKVDDLPLWMRQAHRRVDWGIAFALVLGLLSIWPFITRGGLPRGNALELYVYRAAEMADVVRDGEVYPRWSPNLLYGYGLPLFNYTAPASPYLATLFQIVTESDAVDGARFVLIVGALIGAGGMFAFVRRRWGPVAGLIAVGVYTLSPVTLFLLPYVYGDLPLLWSLQVLPGVFWAIDRVLYRGGQSDLWLLASTFALLMLSDERILLWLLAFIGGWLIWLRLFIHDEKPGTYRLIWIGVILGIGLAAIFWFPALAEWGQVNWLPVSGTTENAPLSLGELLAPSIATDLSVFNPATRRNVGLVAWTFAIGAAMGVVFGRFRTHRLKSEWRHSVENQWWLYFLAIAVVFAIWAVLDETEHLEAQQVLGLLVFPLAVAAGGMSVWLSILRKGWPRQISLALLIALPLISALPLIYPPFWSPDFGDTDAATRLELELNGYGLAMVPAGGWLPLPTTTLPTPSRSLVETYYTGQVDKVNRAATTGVQVDVIEHRATAETLLVRTQNATRIPLFIHAFEGWRIRINERDTAASTIDENGLIQIQVPSGVHTVEVYFGQTLARNLGWLISASAFLAIIGVNFWIVRRQVTEEEPTSVPLLPTKETRIAGGVLVAFLLALPLLIGQQGPFQRQPPGVLSSGASASPRFYAQAGLDLLAYDTTATSITPGDALTLNLYWRAVRSPPDNLQITVSLTDASSGQRIIQSYKQHVGDYPTTLWPLDRYIRDTHRLQTLETISPGTYLLAIELWQCAAPTLQTCLPKQRLIFFDQRAEPLGQNLVLPILITIGS